VRVCINELHKWACSIGGDFGNRFRIVTSNLFKSKTGQPECHTDKYAG
jgi:hypothetical protein